MMSLSSATKQPSWHFSYIRMVLRLRMPFAVMAMVFAVLGLLANYANVDILLRPLGDRSATHPITALCLFGIGFGAYRLKRFGRAPIWRYVLSAAIVGICALRLMEAALGGASGATGLAIFGPISGFHGRFSIESAIALGAFATAGLLRQSLGRCGTVFLVLGAATVFNTLLEISYGTAFFNGDVGAFSLLGMCFAALAMITIYVHPPFVRVAFLMGDIGSQTRTMVFAALTIPWACGFFLHFFKDIEQNFASLETGMISVITWSMLVILLTTSARHEGTDAARRRVERDIAMLSRIDHLTKALNRFGMMEVLEGAWVDFRSSGSKFGLLMLDVNYFRRINETFGHDAGEDVLERVAATIQPQLRDNDALGRWGADEFLVLLHIKAPGDLIIVADRLREALMDVNSPFCAGLSGEPMSITASIGISDIREEDEGPTAAITRADADLYLAKEAGRSGAPLQFHLAEDVDTVLFRAMTDEDIADDEKDQDIIAA